ncbi:hypothetical protein chiPu_0019798 [Chiloscyllium punctatum]|uniref:Uncharacterized protein n=1 Tax=Chiloscyllium punctatum TaxID=137246 RepID=A0A401RT53_CHIPU|nr:hypothetical protein [Chiloscyllium punctatum]
MAAALAQRPQQTWRPRCLNAPNKHGGRAASTPPTNMAADPPSEWRRDLRKILFWGVGGGCPLCLTRFPHRTLGPSLPPSATPNSQRTAAPRKGSPASVAIPLTAHAPYPQPPRLRTALPPAHPFIPIGWAARPVPIGRWVAGPAPPALRLAETRCPSPAGAPRRGACARLGPDPTRNTRLWTSRCDRVVPSDAEGRVRPSGEVLEGYDLKLGN